MSTLEIVLRRPRFPVAAGGFDKPDHRRRRTHPVNRSEVFRTAIRPHGRRQDAGVVRFGRVTVTLEILITPTEGFSNAVAELVI